jgi:magnesium chelatase family protein
MKSQARLKSAILTRNSCQLVSLEACLGRGFSGIQLLGNLGETCREGRERAKTALENAGVRLSQKRILINLSPGDLKKEGNHFDLAFATLLAQLHQPDEAPLFAGDNWVFLGELDLYGGLKPVHGMVPYVLAALENQASGLVLPAANLPDLKPLLPLLESAQLPVIACEHVGEVLAWLHSGQRPQSALDQLAHMKAPAVAPSHNFNDMCLTPELTKLIVCTIAGGHHLLLAGSPGSGKSMLAERLPSVMPRLPFADQLAVLRVYGYSQEPLPASLIEGHRPFRQPHHSLSLQALIGTPSRAGEVSLAHHGLLFLDELPEFRRDALESIREPLETGIIHVARAQERGQWPAHPQLIAACNPCPCGWHGSRLQLCRCGTQQLIRYQAKMSGPLLDRIDIHFWMPEPQSANTFSAPSPNNQTERLQTKIRQALDFGESRRQKIDIGKNAALRLEHFPDAAALTDPELQTLLGKLPRKLGSRRSLIKILRLARTLADYDESAPIQSEHLQQAFKWHQPKRPLEEP